MNVLPVFQVGQRRALSHVGMNTQQQHHHQHKLQKPQQIVGSGFNRQLKLWSGKNELGSLTLEYFSIGIYSLFFLYRYFRYKSFSLKT